MNADIRWIDNPEIFRVNQIAAHSDHDYFTNYEALNSNSHNILSLPVMIRFVISIPCILGKVRPTEGVLTV